jgi:hypothetical protein
MNGTVRCQRIFPNTFNITAATFADITASDSSNASLIYAEQSEQYMSTTSINHTLVHHLSKAVGAILIASVVLNFFFLPLHFFVDTSKPRSGAARILFIFVFLDLCGQGAAVGMVYLIIRNEVGGAYDVALEINSTHWPVKFGLGFWLLVAAAASRPLNVLLSGSSLPLAETEPKHQTQDQRQAYHRQRGRSSRIKKPKSLKDTDNFDKVSYANLISKIAITIKRLLIAVETYQYQEIIDEGCKRLFTEVRDDEKLAFLMPSHFNQNSAALFLGTQSMGPGSPPGLLLWESCPNRGSRRAPESRSPGVYLIVLSECRHGGGRPINTSEYKYVGSGRSLIGGVMLRVAEHTSPEYRSPRASQLYKVWDGLRSPCVAIYLLAEWDPLPVITETFDDILLAEAIWQVVLQTSAQGHMSEFTQFLRRQAPGNDLISNVWKGCNVNSALEKPRQDNNTRR